MLKRTIVRLLLFGIPFGISYWVTKPVTPAAARQFEVCAYPGEQPGELQIDLDLKSCSERRGSKIKIALPHPNSVGVVYDRAQFADDGSGMGSDRNTVHGHRPLLQRKELSVSRQEPAGPF